MSSDKTQNQIERAKAVFTKTYPMQPMVLDRGDGCYLYDTEGKKYLDFAAGIAVATLGHAHPAFVKALTEQAEKFTICPASYTTEPRLELAELLTARCAMDQVYFCNSGAEAVEAALKTARIWAHKEKGPDCKEIITFTNAFHGRTYGAVSVTEKSRTYPEFGPYLPGVHFAEFNNLASVEKLVSEKTCAIIFEPVQGEGGILPATKEFVHGLRALADEHNICLISDEIQAGMGRTGTLYAHEHFGYTPDIVTIAKGMGGGFPVGAMLAKSRYADYLSSGTHGSTYGGNPLACAVALAVVKEVLKPGFLDHVQKMSRYIFEGLEKIRRESNKINDIRGTGLMIGVDTGADINELRKVLAERGLLTTTAGKATLRLTPPLVMTETEADEALEIIGTTLKEDF